MYIFIVIEISNLIKVVISPFFVSRRSDLMMAVLFVPETCGLVLDGYTVCCVDLIETFVMSRYS